jgi:DNA polymerase-3 subunit beta
MDITVQRDALLKPLQAISGIVEKKQTVPVLANVLLTIKEGKLLLIGTDLEVELIGFVPLEAMVAEGTTTVSARKLFDICRALSEGSMLHLLLEKNNLVVQTGASRFKLNTLSPADFPSLDDVAYPTQITIKQNLLKNLLARTYFAMAQQDVRHYLNGVLIDINQGVIKAVAADGHRLALASIHDETIGNICARAILPRKSVLELVRLLAENEQDMTLSINESRFRIVTNDFIFTSKLINAQYPDYNRLVPKSDAIAEGDREEIRHALTRASILSNEKSRIICFELKEGNELVISSRNSDEEHAIEKVNLANYSGKPVEMAFNVAYLLDALSTIAAKTIQFAFADPNNGMVIAAVENDQALYVVMPMRL